MTSVNLGEECDPISALHMAMEHVLAQPGKTIRFEHMMQRSNHVGISGASSRLESF